MDPVAETGRVIDEGELEVPGFVEHNGSAERRNQELLAAHEEDIRHNGEIDRKANPDDWVNPVVARQIFDNWMRSVEAVPAIERLEATGLLDTDTVEKSPDWLDEEALHETLRELVEHLLGEESEVEAVHPRTRVRYQLTPEELPGRRLAIAVAEPDESRVGDSTVISKRAFVYDPERKRFLNHVIFRRVGPGSLESRLDMGHRSDIKEREHKVKPAKLVQCLNDLAESTVLTVTRTETERPEAA